MSNDTHSAAPQTAGLPEPMKVYKIQKLKPKLRWNAKRVRVMYGPFKLKASNSTAVFGNSQSMDPEGTAYNVMTQGDFPKDITILETNSVMADEAGKQLPLSANLYDHHHIMSDVTRQLETFVGCGADGTTKPTSSMPNNIFVGGAMGTVNNRFTSQDGRFNSGFYLPATAQVLLSIDFVNYNNRDVTVYTATEIEYVPGKPKGLQDSSNMVLGLEMCHADANGQGSFHVPEGQKQWTVNGTMIATRDGSMVNAFGHLHDGGVDMTLIINDKKACRSVAEYGGEGNETKMSDGRIWKTLSKMTGCGKPIPIKKGDKLDFVATYDLDVHPARPHAHAEGEAEQMAIWVPAFAVAS